VSVEFLSLEEIRAQQARILEEHPEILRFEKPDCGCGVYCGDWESLPAGGAQAVEEMNTLEWLAGGESWGWLTVSGR
jgi:hypothetical protein